MPPRTMAARSGARPGVHPPAEAQGPSPHSGADPHPHQGTGAGGGEVSPFAVIGFAAVGVFAALLMFSYAQFVVANDAVVTLRNDLKTLQAENVTLSARYEQVFDMERIQAAVGDTMVRPTEEQIVYLDLSEPDSVVLYGEEETASGVRGALQGLKNIVRELTEYFR